MGRKKKPAALSILEGNPGKRKVTAEPPTPDGMPEMPECLDDYGRQEWHKIINGLHVMGIASEVDRAALMAYCNSVSIFMHAREELNSLREKSGTLATMMITTKQGNKINNPLIGVMNKAAGDMVRYASEFGLTPSARARLAIDPNKNKQSKFAGLIPIHGGKK